MAIPAEEHVPGVLFVCTANICRSPIAVALFRSILDQNEIDPRHWRIESAGTWAPKGRPAAPEVITALNARGLDVRKHRSRIVEKDLLNGFPLVLTMEQGQKEALLVEFRSLKGRVFTLAEMAGENGSVEDPTGGPLEAYLQTVNEIERLLRQGLETILLKVKTG